MGLLEAHAALSGKHAVIVGGAYGVGRSVTLALARAGVAVAVCDNDAEALSTITAEVEDSGGQILSVLADVRDVNALDCFYDAVEAKFPALDIVVNVAGGVKSNRLLDTTREENAADIRLNYGYVIDSVRRAVPLIIRGGRGGSIINFTTIEAHRGAATYAVYAGAKAATTIFSRAMAVELGADGIRVNLIAPDTTPSRTSAAAPDPAYMKKAMALPAEVRAQGMKMYIPQQTPPSQDDLANAVLFLASDLSRAVTGMTLHVDGGTMASSGFLEWPFGDGMGPSPRASTLARLFEGGRDE